ncbi:ankyrin repeat domain-containing protein [Coxiella burnetii]|nr:ankyrin repeat protein [Coxiella burnetii RSA 331]AML48346.1 hypothetical protein AUR58_03500 [Coxiella burnetii]AML54352.1 hypothetical protein AYM38_03075 [Coxiella burnetii]ARI66517.1 hypothetical protein B7L74_09045 [Coxiella burnetii]ARK27958.1 hypothetical protein BMW92_08800 [Coxiella burnetii]
MGLGAELTVVDPVYKAEAISLAIFYGQLDLLKNYWHKQNAKMWKAFSDIPYDGNQVVDHELTFILGGNIDGLKWWMDQELIPSNFSGRERKDNALLCAIIHDQVEVLIYLEEQQGRTLGLEVVKLRGKHPVLLAAMHGCLRMLKFLVEKRYFLLEVVDQDGNTPVLLAAYYGHKDLLEYLKDQGLPLHVRNNEKDNAVLLASSRGHFETLEFLVETAKQSVKVFNQYGTSPVLLATSKGHFEIVKYLVERHGQSLDVLTQRGHTPVSLAAQNGHLELLQWLVNEKKQSLGETQQGFPLDLAIEKKQTACAKFIFEHYLNKLMQIGGESSLDVIIDWASSRRSIKERSYLKKAPYLKDVLISCVLPLLIASSKNGSTHYQNAVNALVRSYDIELIRGIGLGLTRLGGDYEPAKKFYKKVLEDSQFDKAQRDEIRCELANLIFARSTERKREESTFEQKNEHSQIMSLPSLDSEEEILLKIRKNVVEAYHLLWDNEAQGAEELLETINATLSGGIGVVSEQPKTEADWEPQSVELFCDYYGSEGKVALPHACWEKILRTINEKRKEEKENLELRAPFTSLHRDNSQKSSSPRLFKVVFSGFMDESRASLLRCG